MAVNPTCSKCGELMEEFVDEGETFWECPICGETEDYEYPMTCPDCWGTGRIYCWINDSQPFKCDLCDGIGSF